MTSRYLAPWVRVAWLAFWRIMRFYFRYEVKGFEHLAGPASLLVGYHGRPLAHDLCMLTVTVYERLGYIPHGVVHSFFEESRVFSPLVGGLGFVTGDGPHLEIALARGEHILVQPGGTREGCRSFRHRYQVDWGERLGYLRLAIRHGLRIIPIAGQGVDDAFVGLNNGYALGRRLRLPARLPLWFGVGLTGFWPLALPFPVKMVQVIGRPIDPAAEGVTDAEDRAAVLALHRKVLGTVQDLLDQANGRGSGGACGAR